MSPPITRHAERQTSQRSKTVLIVLMIVPSYASLNDTETRLAQDYAFFTEQSSPPEPHDERLLLGVYPATLRSTSNGALHADASKK